MSLQFRPCDIVGSPPRLPINPVTGEADESEVPLDEIQSRFFLLRDDGGVGCRFCLSFHTKEQIRPLYPLRDHVHSVHYKIFPYRCNDCAFKTSSYRLSFSHAEATGHRRAIVQRTSTHQPLRSKFAQSAKTSTTGKKKRKSNPLENDGRRAAAAEEIELEIEDNVEIGNGDGRVPEVDGFATTPHDDELDTVSKSYVVPSFLPTPPLTPRIQKEYFRYDIEGFLQCSKCEYRVQSASTEGPGSRKALLEHVYATHIENLPWTCRDCQFTTKFKSNLVRHCRKLKHAPNEERHAPPGVREPDVRVVAASAKRVKWAGVDISRSENQQTPNYEDEESAHEHGYSIPTITPALRISWQAHSKKEDGSMQVEAPQERKEENVRLQWTGQSVEPISISSLDSPLPPPAPPSPPALSRKRKTAQRVRSDGDDDTDVPAKKTSSISSNERNDSDTTVANSPDSRLSPEALREKYVKTVENNAGARCAICDFVIRKTSRVNDPLTIMLSHVCGHLALVLRITCIACGYMTDNAANWESHRSESELDGGPLAAHEPSFAVAVDRK